MFGPLPRGLVADLVTPLDAAGPDIEAFTWLVRRVSRHVSAVLAGGSRAGEGLELSRQQRLALFRAASRSAGDTPLIFEITAPTLEETLALAEGAEKRLKGHHAPVFFALTPLLFYSNRDLPGLAAELGRLTRRPLVLINDPGLTGSQAPLLKHKNIRTQVVKKLAGVGQVAGLIYQAQAQRSANYQRAVRARPDFRLFEASEREFMARPSSSGLVSAGACLMPQAWADLVASSINNFEGERLGFNRLSGIWEAAAMAGRLAAFYQGREPLVIKGLLHRLGRIPSPRAAALGRLTPPEEENLARLAQQLLNFGA